ncbi:MAG: signal recognition particle-docking protein FtsY [Candidatus Micrarchaeales archaeon]
MFDGLRKKLSEAVKGFVKKEKTEIEEAQKEEIKKEVVQEARQQVQEQSREPEVKKEEKIEAKKEVPKQEQKKEEKKEKEIVKLSFATKLKSVIVSSVHLKDNEIDDFLESIKVSLLESDVSYETTDAFLENLRLDLKSAKIDAKNINKELIELVRKSLFEILSKSGNGIDVPNFVKERISAGNTPVKILFLGPNGTGKTTSIAKLAYKFKNLGISSVLSASDTFRAAAIEQTEHHANKVGVPVIKSKYGADPASIAFDAIAYAKSHNIQVVLIDSAGRQETNKNLISEMQKMVRVAKPDLIVFVGESTAGNVLSEQIKEFNKFMKIDGIILTKLDCDAKGGNAISIAYTTGIPLLFIGTGESYDALIPYTPSFIVDAIIPNN